MMMIRGNKDEIELEVRCPFCKGVSNVIVPTEGFDRWQKGDLIQRAMPEVPAETREILIGGMCLKCQKMVFGE